MADSACFKAGTSINMTSMEDWKILDFLHIRAEARVVESFLRAQGLEVQLLDTYMNTHVPSTTLSGTRNAAHGSRRPNTKKPCRCSRKVAAVHI